MTPHDLFLNFTPSTLREKVKPWVMGRDEKTFTSTCAEEAKDLRSASFGTRMLACIGWIYENKANQYLSEQCGEWAMFSGAGWAETGARHKRNVRLVGNVASAGMALRKIQENMSSGDDDDVVVDDAGNVKNDEAPSSKQPKGAKDSTPGKGGPAGSSSPKKNPPGAPGPAGTPAGAASSSGTTTNNPAAGGSAGTTTDKEQARQEKKAKALADVEQTLPVFLEVIWDLSEQDIEQTVAHVTKMLLYDVSVPWIIRIRRAAALQRMGRIFQDIATLQEGELDSKAAREKIESAFVTTMTKEKDEKKK